MKELLKIISVILGIVSLLGVMFTYIPLLGWVNWFIIPFATIGLIVSSIAESSGGKSLCIITMVFGILRLMFFGGFL